jgi:hypothetical protein
MPTQRNPIGIESYWNVRADRCMSLRRWVLRTIMHCYLLLNSQKKLKSHLHYLYLHFAETNEHRAAKVKQLVKAVGGKDIVVIALREEFSNTKASLGRGLERTDTPS